MDKDLKPNKVCIDIKETKRGFKTEVRGCLYTAGRIGLPLKKEFKDRGDAQQYAINWSCGWGVGYYESYKSPKTETSKDIDTERMDVQEQFYRWVWQSEV